MYIINVYTTNIIKYEFVHVCKSFNRVVNIVPIGTLVNWQLSPRARQRAMNFSHPPRGCEANVSFHRHGKSLSSQCYVELELRCQTPLKSLITLAHLVCSRNSTVYSPATQSAFCSSLVSSTGRTLLSTDLLHNLMLNHWSCCLLNVEREAKLEAKAICFSEQLVEFFAIHAAFLTATFSIKRCSHAQGMSHYGTCKVSP